MIDITLHKVCDWKLYYYKYLEKWRIKESHYCEDKDSLFSSSKLNCDCGFITVLITVVCQIACFFFRNKTFSTPMRSTCGQGWGEGRKQFVFPMQTLCFVSDVCVICIEAYTWLRTEENLALRERSFAR